MLSKTQKALIVLASTAALAVADMSFAGQRGPRGGGGRGHSGGGGGGHAVPRGSVRPTPGGSRIAPYRGYDRGRYYSGAGRRYYSGRPYRYGYPGFYGYGYHPFGYGYGPYSYGWYGYGYPGYGFGGYGYAPFAYQGFVGVAPGRPYGGVRIDLPERDAEVYVDGYYAGVVDDFDGALQELKLEPGPHRLEIRAEGFEPVTFDVDVDPGRTITYRTRLRPDQP